jgi:hypothetical protein
MKNNKNPENIIANPAKVEFPAHFAAFPNNMM